MESSQIDRSLLERLIQDQRRSLATVDDQSLASLPHLIPIAPGLPDELLLQVFINAVDMEEDERRRLASNCELYNRGKMPLVIAGVCKRWRGIALGSSSLWRYINIITGEDDDLEHWLTYSLPHSRELSLSYWDAQFLNEIPSLPFSLTTNSYQNPFKHRRIEISTSYDRRETINTSSFWPSNYPLADEVVLLSSCSDSIWNFFRPLVLQAQKLVVSRIVPTPWHEYSWDFLNDLTIIGALGDPDLILLRAEIMDLFTSAHHLSKVFIEWDPMCTDDSTAGHYYPVIYPQLQSLSCSFDAIELYLHPLQELLTFPNLTELIFLTFLPYTSDCLLGWSVALKSTSPSPLRHLQLPDLSRPPVDLDDILPIFGLLPCLERLTLTGSKVDALLQRLIIDNMEFDTPTILPSLIRLDIRDSDATNYTIERLITSRLASNRARDGVRIENMTRPGVEPGTSSYLARGSTTEPSTSYCIPTVREITVVNIYECPGITPQGWQRILVLLEMAKK